MNCNDAKLFSPKINFSVAKCFGLDEINYFVATHDAINYNEAKSAQNYNLTTCAEHVIIYTRTQ